MYGTSRTKHRPGDPGKDMKGQPGSLSAVEPEAPAGLLEKREWIEGYRGRWYRRKLYCRCCGIKIRTESWDEKRCFGIGTILADNTMPKFCPNCGVKIPEGGAGDES